MSHSFNGIINNMKKETNIKDEINLSSSWDSNFQDWDIFNYDGERRQMCSGTQDNPSICIEFKHHSIKPTHYSIRAGLDSDNPKSLILEGSNDKEKWTVIDEQMNVNYFKEPLSFHTFSIEEEKSQIYKYIRLRHKGNNWGNGSCLQINSIEFFGELF